MNTAQILTDLRAQRDRINQAIAALAALNGTAVSPRTAKTATKTVARIAINSAKTASGVLPNKKRVVSPEARQRMAEAQQKRWAKKKRATAKVAEKAAAATA